MTGEVFAEVKQYAHVYHFLQKCPQEVELEQTSYDDTSNNNKKRMMNTPQNHTLQKMKKNELNNDKQQQQQQQQQEMKGVCLVKHQVEWNWEKSVMTHK